MSATTVGTDADFANDRIRIYDKGFFMVNLGISFAQTGTDTVIWTFRIATDIDGAGATYPGFDAAVQRSTATLENMVSASGIIDTTGHTTYTDVTAQVKHDTMLVLRISKCTTVRCQSLGLVNGRSCYSSLSYGPPVLRDATVDSSLVSELQAAQEDQRALINQLYPERATCIRCMGIICA